MLVGLDDFIGLPGLITHVQKGLGSVLVRLLSLHFLHDPAALHNDLVSHILKIIFFRSLRQIFEFFGEEGPGGA